MSDSRRDPVDRVPAHASDDGADHVRTGAGGGERLGVIRALLSGQPAAEPEILFALHVVKHQAALATAQERAIAREDARRRPGPPPDWADLHPTAAELDGVPPGAQLVTDLLGLRLADEDDAALIEIIAAWERVVSWATGRQADAVNELRRRREAQRRDAYLPDEIGARLGTTRAAAESKVGLACSLEQLPRVADALSRGDVDARKAVTLADELLAVEEPVRTEIMDAVLPRVAETTGARLRARIRRLALASNPAAARERHRRARADRHVEISPTRDGMAWLHAFLPAEQAVAVHMSLTALADAAGREDPRSMDARRADALVDVTTRWLDADTSPDGLPLPTRHRRRPHLNVTATRSSLLGLDDEPAHLAGYGAIPIEMARSLAAASTWTPLLVDAQTGEIVARGRRSYRPSSAQTDWIVDRDPECTFPGCRVAAVRCDIDHVEPFDPGRDAAEQTRVGNLQPLCRHHHRAKTHGGWRATRGPDGVTRWQAPTGHSYERTAQRLDGSEGHDGPPIRSEPERRRPDDEPPPPY